MRILPKDEKEKIIVGIVAIIGFAIYHSITNLLVSYYPNIISYYSTFEYETYYYIIYLLIFSVAYLVFGFIIGLFSNLKSKRAYNVFIRGVFFYYFSFFY